VWHYADQAKLDAEAREYDLEVNQYIDFYDEIERARRLRALCAREEQGTGPAIRNIPHNNTPTLFTGPYAWRIIDAVEVDGEPKEDYVLPDGSKFEGGEDDDDVDETKENTVPDEVKPEQKKLTYTVGSAIPLEVLTAVQEKLVLLSPDDIDHLVLKPDAFEVVNPLGWSYPSVFRQEYKVTHFLSDFLNEASAQIQLGVCKQNFCVGNPLVCGWIQNRPEEPDRLTSAFVTAWRQASPPDRKDFVRIWFTVLGVPTTTISRPSNGIRYPLKVKTGEASVDWKDPRSLNAVCRAGNDLQKPPNEYADIDIQLKREAITRDDNPEGYSDWDRLKDLFCYNPSVLRASALFDTVTDWLELAGEVAMVKLKEINGSSIVQVSRNPFVWGTLVVLSCAGSASLYWHNKENIRNMFEAGPSKDKSPAAEFLNWSSLAIAGMGTAFALNGMADWNGSLKSAQNLSFLSLLIGRCLEGKSGSKITDDIYETVLNELTFARTEITKRRVFYIGALKEMCHQTAVDPITNLDDFLIHQDARRFMKMIFPSLNPAEDEVQYALVGMQDLLEQQQKILGLEARLLVSESSPNKLIAKLCSFFFHAVNFIAPPLIISLLCAGVWIGVGYFTSPEFKSFIDKTVIGSISFESTPEKLGLKLKGAPDAVLQFVADMTFLNQMRQVIEEEPVLEGRKSGAGNSKGTYGFVDVYDDDTGKFMKTVWSPEIQSKAEAFKTHYNTKDETFVKAYVDTVILQDDLNNSFYKLSKSEDWWKNEDVYQKFALLNQKQEELRSRYEDIYAFAENAARGSSPGTFAFRSQGKSNASKLTKGDFGSGPNAQQGTKELRDKAPIAGGFPIKRARALVEKEIKDHFADLLWAKGDSLNVRMTPGKTKGSFEIQDEFIEKTQGWLEKLKELDQVYKNVDITHPASDEILAHFYHNAHGVPVCILNRNNEIAIVNYYEEKLGLVIDREVGNYLRTLASMPKDKFVWAKNDPIVKEWTSDVIDIAKFYFPRNKDGSQKASHVKPTDTQLLVTEVERREKEWESGKATTKTIPPTKVVKKDVKGEAAPVKKVVNTTDTTTTESWVGKNAIRCVSCLHFHSEKGKCFGADKCRAHQLYLKDQSKPLCPVCVAFTRTSEKKPVVVKGPKQPLKDPVSDVSSSQSEESLPKTKKPRNRKKKKDAENTIEGPSVVTRLDLDKWSKCFFQLFVTDDKPKFISNCFFAMDEAKIYMIMNKHAVQDGLVMKVPSQSGPLWIPVPKKGWSSFGADGIRMSFDDYAALEPMLKKASGIKPAKLAAAFPFNVERSFAFLTHHFTDQKLCVQGGTFTRGPAGEVEHNVETDFTSCGSLLIDYATQSVFAVHFRKDATRKVNFGFVLPTVDLNLRSPLH
jgi:hypothetical protein